MKLFLPLIFIAVLLAACQSNRPKDLSAEETAGYLEKGKQIVQASFSALSGQLSGAMQKGGVQNAVAYCNIKANPIMDSLSQAHQVTISRVTLRPRNPENLSDDNESEILSDFLKMQDLGKSLQPFIESASGEQVIFYAPITIISPLCLNCHGTPGSEISTEDYELIKSLYPDDQATGYSMNELRGMWKVEFH